jgi:hypothetical protein
MVTLRKWYRSKTRSNETGAEATSVSAPVSFDLVFEDLAKQTKAFRRQFRASAAKIYESLLKPAEAWN